MSEKGMNRHEVRVMAMESMYQFLLLHNDSEACRNNIEEKEKRMRKCLFEAMKGKNEVPELLYDLTIASCENIDLFMAKVQTLLRSDWDIDRLSYIEQAIFMISFQEILVVKTPKQVVINEAVTLAKKYCDDNSYKLINGVLDRI